MELVSSESIDTLDSLCSSIRVDLKGSEVVRILPRRNDLTNQDWITNKTRYSFDGLKNQRFSYPMLYVKDVSSFKISTWDSFYSSFNLNYLSSISSSSFGTFELGNGLDLYTIYLSNLLARSLSFVSTSNNLFNSDLRASYLCSSFSNIDTSDLIYINGNDFSTSFPLINARIQQKLNSKKPSTVLYSGLNHKFNYDVYHFGLSNFSTFSFFRGKHFCSSFLNLTKRISIFSESTFLNSIACSVPCSNNINFNLLMHDTTSIGSAELGSLYGGSTVLNYSFYYGLNLSVLPCSTLSSFCVLHSTHSKVSLSALRSSNVSTVWYLPTFSALESEYPYINLLGMIQWTRKCSSSFGESVTYEDVLRRLISLNSFNNFDLSFDRFISKVPSLCGDSLLPNISFLRNSKTQSFSNLSFKRSDSPFVEFCSIKL